MIQIIYGHKGSGKTKKIIDMANQTAQESRHDVVFIDDDNRYMFDLRHEVRFINATEYPIKTSDAFLGLLCGIVAQNFDVGMICIDAFKKMIKCDISETAELFACIESLSEKHSIDFVISISLDKEEMPEWVQKHIN